MYKMRQKRRIFIFLFNKKGKWYKSGYMYGEGVIKRYSIKLTAELGKGYTVTRLKYYKEVL